MYQSNSQIRNVCLVYGLGALLFCLVFFVSFAAAAEEAKFQARGLVRSSDRVEIRTDLVASIISADYSEGMKFKKGSKLLAFDCRRQQAELSSAKASASAAKIELTSKRVLRRNGAAGKNEVELAQAAVNRTLADVKAISSRMNHCIISAPFSGRVVALNVRRFEIPNANQAMMVIIDDQMLELELVVPSRWIRWLKPDEKFEFKVDETGLTHKAKIIRLAAEVNAVSQTIKAYGAFEGDLSSVLAGMSGVALFANRGM